MLLVRYYRCLTTFLFENSADCALAGAGHSDVIEGMVFTGVTDIEPGSVYLRGTSSDGDELVGRDEV